MTECKAHAICCRSLSKSFGETPVLRSLNLCVDRGELVCLLGPSGCGKTTLLRCIAGFEHPGAGSIQIGGKTVAGAGLATPAAPEARRVGVVFQEAALFPHLSVLGNVAFGLSQGRGLLSRLGRGPGRAERARAREMLDLVGLADKADRRPGELSGGEQQRVALARALAPEPEVVLLDEPFANLDRSLRLTLRREVRDALKACGATAILVTHDQDEAFTMADRVGVMLDGEIAQIEPPERIYDHPADTRVASMVGRGALLDASVEDGGLVCCGLGRVSADGIGEACAGAGCSVFVRPEGLRLNPEGCPRSVAGRVVRVEYAGDHRLVTVDIGNGAAIPVKVDPNLRVSVGTEVGVEVVGPVRVVRGVKPPSPVTVSAKRTADAGRRDR
ncbi:MAG: ABC transporter ATP-binding protein [Phycisphaerales bacterium]|nr:ABC transporter ATP-binding protein [Phycisphaerales bacterium]